MILDSLNKAQLAAVQAPLQHQLVLAGAGSGKTRVLTHRIGWLIQQEHISPFEILAVTFTNKAANEIRSRLEKMLSISTKAMWVGTFHGISHRFLRLHWEAASLPRDFQILDSEDQLRLIRRIIHSFNLDDTQFPPKECQWFINSQKESLYGDNKIDHRHPKTTTYLKIFQTYQETCQRNGMIDFSDLLYKTCQLLQSNPELRQHYQARFRCLLVDEFQDTNEIQYAWLKLFSGEKSAIMIVGDDDQSIYGWRGAKVENIQQFSTDYPSVSIIRLEQNYRSTGTILKAANALIEKNAKRLGKNLWTEGKEGEPITIYAASNETEEAFYIINRIRALRENDTALREIAILYRSNAQSRLLEETLMRYSIPYRVYGGLRYFDRAEIKDALAYLKLMNNLADDTSFERIINFPARGIGEKTLSVIRDQARTTNTTLWEALQHLFSQHFFTARTLQHLQTFVALMQSLRENALPLELDKQVEYVLLHSGLLEHYRKEKGEKGLTRLENLEELVNAAHHFLEDAQPVDMSPLSAFLSYAALESGDEQTEAYEDGVQLMTLHAAKGLEFPVVFLSGCEEELFPHYLSIHDPKSLEEERRLCYVGVTRAMKKLYMTYAETRYLHGKSTAHQPSRFLRDIPPELVEAIRFQTKVSKPFQKLSSSSSSQNINKFVIGQNVNHRTFGEGVIIGCEGQGEQMKVKVRFRSAGTKVLIASYLE